MNNDKSHTVEREREKENFKKQMLKTVKEMFNRKEKLVKNSYVQLKNDHVFAINMKSVCLVVVDKIQIFQYNT